MIEDWPAFLSTLAKTEHLFSKASLPTGHCGTETNTEDGPAKVLKEQGRLSNNYHYALKSYKWYFFWNKEWSKICAVAKSIPTSSNTIWTLRKQFSLDVSEYSHSWCLQGNWKLQVRGNPVVSIGFSTPHAHYFAFVVYPDTKTAWFLLLQATQMGMWQAGTIEEALLPVNVLAVCSSIMPATCLLITFPF